MQNICEEEWREVTGYSKRYMISSKGRFMRFDKKGVPIITCGYKDKSTGYMQVSLWKDGKTKHNTIHRLLAIAFLPNPENKAEIDHINGQRDDNRIENLRWATRTENRNNPISIERLRIAFTGPNSPHYGRKRSTETCKRISDALKASPKCHGRKGALNKHSVPVHQYDLLGRYIRTFAGMNEAKRETGVSEGDISAVCSGRKSYAGNYIWRKDKLETVEVPTSLVLKKFGKPVLQCDMEGNVIKEWQNARVAANALNINKDCINNCCGGRPQVYKGYKWKYKQFANEHEALLHAEQVIASYAEYM